MCTYIDYLNDFIPFVVIMLSPTTINYVTKHPKSDMKDSQMLFSGV